MMEEKPPPLAGQRQTRRQFTREFKVEAVELVLRGDKTAVELAWVLRHRMTASEKILWSVLRRR
ncbi:MAG: hypothetical protein ACETWG_04865 [Candidatus Neomarinimicrobiota bacterium]